MAHLCSAHLGKKPKKTKSACGQRWEDCGPFQTPGPRGDEYGFLPWFKGQGSLPRACQKKNISRQLPTNVEKLISRDRERVEETNNVRGQADLSLRLQRYPMSEIINILRERATKGVRNTSGVRRSLLQTPPHRSASYPRDLQEFVTRLESSNQRLPANIPVLVKMDYSPNDTLVRGGVIRVTRGMVVNAIYKCQDWIYIISPENHSGYVPFECLDPIGLTRKSLDVTQQFPDATRGMLRTASVERLDTSGTTGSPFPSPGDGQPVDATHKGTTAGSLSSPSNSPCSGTTFNDIYDLPYHDTTFSTCDQSRRYLSDDSGIHDKPEDSVGEGTSIASVELEKTYTIMEDAPIYENVSEMLDNRPLVSSTGSRLTVLFDYIPIHSQDLTVRAQEVVKLISEGEGDWIWVEKQGGVQGFIPRNYAINLARFNLEPDAKTTYL